MPSTALIKQLEKQLPNQQFLPAPEYPGDPYAGLMISQNKLAKYLFDEKGRLTGLNLANCGLDDAGWQSILNDIGEQRKTLTMLNLSGNKLSRFEFVPGMEQLRQVNLSENAQLEQLKFSIQLSQLEKLFLSESNLQELRLRNGFKALKWLDLRGNKLQRLSFDAACPALEWLDLSENELNDLPLKNGAPLAKPGDLEQIAPQLRELFIANNSLPEVLRGFLENHSGNCLDIVRRQLRELGKGIETDNECKLLLIGNGCVGKTCFVERLVRNRFLEKWGSTHAIFIEEQFPLDEWLLNIWDFGGQDIYHATHRLFMQANSVYLLFWDLESEGKKYSPPLDESGELRHYENYELSYWLDYAQSRGKEKVPVIVVQTKTGLHGKKDQAEIREKYEPLFSMLEFEHIESKEPDPKKNGYRNLLNSIDTAVSTIKPPNAMLPANYAAIRRQLRELRQAGENYLPLDDFLKRAVDLDIEAPMEVLQSWLTGTGVVFYKKGLFKNEIILNQA